MAPWEEPWTPCKTKAKTKETIVPLPFPFEGQLILTSMKEENQTQAKIEYQYPNGKTVTIAKAVSSLELWDAFRRNKRYADSSRVWSDPEEIQI